MSWCMCFDCQLDFIRKDDIKECYYCGSDNAYDINNNDFCDICEEPYGKLTCELCNTFVCEDCCETINGKVVCYNCIDEYYEYLKSEELLICPNCLKRELYIINIGYKCWSCKKIIFEKKGVKNDIFAK